MIGIFSLDFLQSFTGIGEAFLGVITALLGLITAFLVFQNTKIEQIRSSVEYAFPKPLEGIWDITFQYTKFHGETGHWNGIGEAIILWQHELERYSIHYGFSITKKGETQPVLSGYKKGYISPIDSEGWPKVGAAIKDNQYIARLHRDIATTTFPSSSYTDLKLEKNGLSPYQITAKLCINNYDTEANITLIYKTKLH